MRKKEKIIKFLEQEKYSNAFVFSQIDEDKTTLYPFFDADDNVIACYTTMGIYSHFVASAVFSDYKKVADKYSELHEKNEIDGSITGKEEWIIKFMEYVPHKIKITKTEILAMEEQNLVANNNLKIKKLQPENYESYNKLMKSAFDMEYSDEKLEERKDKTLVITEGAEVVSTATYTSPQSASMIVSVATKKSHRNKGYAQSVLSQMCKIILEQNAKPVLFTDNPNAKKLYLKLGFTYQGKYIMGKLEK